MSGQSDYSAFAASDKKMRSPDVSPSGSPILEEPATDSELDSNLSNSPLSPNNIAFEDDDSLDSPPTPFRASAFVKKPSDSPERQSWSFGRNASLPATRPPSVQTPAPIRSTAPTAPTAPTMTGLSSDMMERKRKFQMLFKIKELNTKHNISTPMDVRMSSSLEDIQMVLSTMIDSYRKRQAVESYRKMLVMGTSVVEWGNTRYDPFGFHLKGWSESVYDSVSGAEYDEIFEELHEKYKSDEQSSPEMRLMMMLAGSAFMHHTFHKTSKSFSGMFSGQSSGSRSRDPPRSNGAPGSTPPPRHDTPFPHSPAPGPASGAASGAASGPAFTSNQEPPRPKPTKRTMSGPSTNGLMGDNGLAELLKGFKT